MTMDNGEGRPLDELESGQQDPQDWYFDLPSDAWKRQEEKNRQLRERVRSGEQEPPERARRDPWVLNRPAPEPPKKRGLFGLGRKKKDGEEEPRRAAPQQGAFGGWMSDPRDGEDEDDWSTERLEPGIASQPLQLKPRRGAAPVEPPDAAREPAGTVEPPPLRLRPRREQEEGSRLNWDFGPGAWPGPEAEQPAGEPTADAGDDGESIVSQMRAWAERGREDGHRRFGTGFEAAGNGNDEPAPRQLDAAGFAPEPADAEPAVGMVEAHRPEVTDAAPESRPGWNEERGTAGAPQTPGLPLIRRRQPEEREPGREPGKSSKWDEFFGLNREAAEDDEGGAGVSEGLAAMREWAKKKPLGEDVRDLNQVPEEFLKPFDWELEEQGAGVEAAAEGEPGAETAAPELPTAWADGGDEDADSFAAFAASEAETSAAGHEEAFDGAAAWPTDADDARDDAFAAFTPQERDGGERGGLADATAEWRDLEDRDETAPFFAFTPQETEAAPSRDAFETAAQLNPRDDATGPFAPFSRRDGEAAGDDDPLAGLFPARDDRAAQEPPKEKRGLFGRLFGRKRQDEPAADFAPGTDWRTAWQFEQDGRDDAGASGSFESEQTPGVFEGGRLVADEAPTTTPEGWGANAGEALADDVEAVSDFAAQVQSLAWQLEEESREPAAGAVLELAEETAGPADVEGWAPEVPAAFARDARPGDTLAAPNAAADDEDEWAPEPVELGGGAFEPVEFPRAFAERAQGEVEAGGGEQGWAPEPVELSPAAFGAAVQAALWGDGESETPAVEPVGDEPRPWWEAPEAEEAVEEAVASAAESVSPATDAASGEPRPWWEASEAEETVEGAVASVAEPASPAVEPASEEPRPWWEAGEAEGTVEEAVASVAEPASPVVDSEDEEPRPWWEAGEAEEAVEGAVASVAEPASPVADVTSEEPRPWWEASEAEETAQEAVASVAEPVSPAADAANEELRPWWEASEAEETVEEAVASGAGPVSPAADVTSEEPRPWWEASEAEETVEEAVASVAEPASPAVEPASEEPRPWWEAGEAEEAVEGAVASAAESVSPAADAASDEPRPWWEAGEAEEAVEGAVASAAESVSPAADAAGEEPRPWWEVSEADEAVEEAVASVAEPVSPASDVTSKEPRPWWEATEAEETVEEAVASVAEPASPAVEPAAEEPRPWWEASEAEETVEEAVASAAEPASPAEPASEEPRPWWEASEAEETVEEAVASAVEPASPAVEPAAEEPRPWWETSEAEETVEAAVASAVEPASPAVEPAVEEPRPWWEASEAEETVEEAAASAAEPARPAEPVSEEPRPWWEASEAEETVEEAVASIAEPASPAVEPASASEEPRPWWEATEAEDAVEEAVASIAEPASPAVEPAAEEPRPWWERLGEQPVPANDEAAVLGGTPAEARFGGAEDLAGGDEDMWGDIAETAELAVALPGGEDDLDLAASLEAQMDAADEPPWARPSPVYDGEEPEFVSTEDEGDVILKAFEAHASTPEPEPASPEVDAETAAALEALFGSQGTQIVEETGEEPAERPFIRMAAWAPQRGAPADDGWAPAEEVAAEFERRNAPIGFELDPLAAAPPWASEPAETDGRAAERARGDGRLKAWIREVVETVMLAALVFLSVRASFGNFKVDGNSMYPTLENGQFLIVNKLVYSEVDLEKLSTFLPFINPGDDPTRYVFHGPERGDIVVLRDPRDPSTDLIKRVIGLPGETIEIVNGKVYINDRLLEEPYITTPWNDTLPKILIPPDEYFVMGDNRNNSLDSRSAQVGLVSKDLIIGKATLSYLPLNRFGLAPNQKGVLTDQKPVLTTKRLGED